MDSCSTRNPRATESCDFIRSPKTRCPQWSVLFGGGGRQDVHILNSFFSHIFRLRGYSASACSRR